MNWYYVREGQQAGPVSDAEFEGLVANGQVTDSTLVWREGMANWQPYGDVKSPLAPSPGTGPGPQGAAAEAVAAEAPGPAAVAAVAGVGEVVCAECGGIFPRDNAIQYGASWVCASCKPVFIQKLKEGAAGPGALAGLRYAGFWVRFAAIFVDGILLWAVNLGLAFLTGLSFMQAVGVETPQNLALQWTLTGIQFLMGICYETVMVGKYGATLGKMAMGLRVVTADGGPVSYSRALGRYFGKILSYVTCSIGFIVAAFDDQKRALHDHICSTRVIRTR